MIKYRENMTEAELAALKAEIDALDAAYAEAAAADAAHQALHPVPDEWEDPSDYVRMGWVDSRGRP